MLQVKKKNHKKIYTVKKTIFFLVYTPKKYLYYIINKKNVINKMLLIKCY